MAPLNPDSYISNLFRFYIFLLIIYLSVRYKMEREFLKEYNLYSDLVRLNHYDYYQSSFTTPDTLEHFISIQHEDKKKIKPLC